LKPIKVLCTGNPNDIGIAQEIRNIFPDASFVSRSSGFNLETEEGRTELKKILPKFDVLINNAYVTFGFQKALLILAKEVWESGHVFNIGSLDEYELYSHVNPRSHTENNELKNLGLSFNNDKFKVTHITVGIFKSSKKPKTLELDVMDPKCVAGVIKWILDCGVDIPVIGVQKMSDDVSALYKNYSSAT
jgi:hypothetical protein